MRRAPRLFGRISPALCILACVSGCVAGRSAPLPAAPGAPDFDPIAFFAGRTHGTGVLHVLFRGAKTTDVRGIGVAMGEGRTGGRGGSEIILDQSVVQGESPARHRRWRLHRDGPGRYTGTLTDAVGPVVALAQGNRLRIAFTLKGGLAVDQRLSLEPGGRVALNVMTVRKFGLVVARLDERIERMEG